jgi:cell division septation protein DedD
MRDVEQMREKVQISFEGRQIAALSVGMLVLLCSVFALGLALGRKLSQEAPRSAALSALDAQSDKVVPAGKPAAAEKPAPSKPPEETASPATGGARTRVALAEKPSPAKKPEVVHPAPTAETALADTKKDVAVVAPPAREALVVPPPKSSDPGGVALTPPPKDLGAYTVQIGASPDRAEAARLESRARAAGLKPYVVEADLGAKGTWYRVRVGSFPDKEKAGRYRTDVERELRSTAIVMASH